jgi:hypothetical protein
MFRWAKIKNLFQENEHVVRWAEKESLSGWGQKWNSPRWDDQMEW